MPSANNASVVSIALSRTSSGNCFIEVGKRWESQGTARIIGACLAGVVTGAIHDICHRSNYGCLPI